jgi:hypothetical protein
VPRLREFKWDSWLEERAERFAADRPSIVALDTETTGLEFYDVPFAAQLTWRGRDNSLQSAYVDLEAECTSLLPLPDQDQGNVVHRLTLLRDILHLSPTWVLHNAKFDLQKLLLFGVITDEMLEQHEIEDTQTMFHLLDENSPKGLKALAVSVLKYDDTIMVPYKTGKKKGTSRPVSKEKYLLDRTRRKLKLNKKDGYHLLPRAVVVPYALKDTEFTLGLYEVLKPKLEALREKSR